MRLVTTAQQFFDVLQTARRVYGVRQDLETFESERLAMYADLTRDWLGGARDDFDGGWEISGDLKGDVVEQLEGFEAELAEVWAMSVEEHNERAYDAAIRDAAVALQAEREEHNALVEGLADLDAMTFGIFNDQPDDRVPRANIDVPHPTAGENYAANTSFAHLSLIHI